jgi:hypothetical protein
MGCFEQMRGIACTLGGIFQTSVWTLLGEGWAMRDAYRALAMMRHGIMAWVRYINIGRSRPPAGHATRYNTYLPFRRSANVALHTCRAHAAAILIGSRAAHIENTKRCNMSARAANEIGVT